MSLRIAIHFFGHLRTFKETYNSFFRKVVTPNQKDGFLIDIFMHTWDEYEAVHSTWHTDNSSIAGKKVSKEDIEFAKQVYHPKKFLIGTMNVGHGRDLSLAAVNKLREEYAEEKKIKYDYYFYCRPDVLFFTPLRLKKFLDVYSLDSHFSIFPLPREYSFVASSVLNRLPVMDPRNIAEGDIVWFGSVPCDLNTNLLRISIKYILCQDFTLERANLGAALQLLPYPYDKKKKYMLSRWITTACLPFKKLRSRWR